MILLEALDCAPPFCAAIVGAGGKTTASFMLARQVSGPAWVSTTTHLGTDQTTYADLHFILHSLADMDTQAFLSQKTTLLTGGFTTDNRVYGPDEEVLNALHAAAELNNVSLILEADGSRSIPLKAPGDHEPPIPAWVKEVIVVVGASVLGKPLSGQTVFRSSRYAELTGLHEGDPISPEDICAMLVHPLGGLKNVPPSAKKVALFNQCDTRQTRQQIKKILPALLQGGYERIILAALKTRPEDCEAFG